MKTVLVVEGDRKDQETLQALLTEHGYNVNVRSSRSLQVSEVIQVEASSDLQIEEKAALAIFRSDLDGKLYEVRQAKDAPYEVSPPPYGSEQHFREVYENAPLGIFRSSLPGKLLSVNPFCARMLKFDSPRDMIETVNTAGIAETLYLDADHRQEILSEVLASNGWHVFEEKFRCKDGSLIDCFFHLRAVRDDQGQSVELEGFVENISERKRAERFLKFTQFAIDNSIDQAFWSGTDGRFIYVNEAACRTLGYSREELLQMSVPDIAVSFSAETFAEHQRELKEKGFLTFEILHRAKDGRVYPVEIRANSVIFDGKEYTCAFATDISERRRTEQALRFTQFAIDNSIDQAFWIDEGARLLYVNDAACRTLGYSRKELLQMSVPDVGPTFPAEVFAEHWRELKKKGALTFESCHRAKDGRIYPVEIRSKYVEFGGKEYICAFVTDISERKRTEEALKLGQEMIDGASMGIFRGGEDGRILFVNDFWARKLGYTPAELRSMTFFDIDPTLTREFWQEHRQKVATSGFNSFESVHRCKDGTEIPVEVTVNLFWHQGQVYSCSFAKDISERKQAEKALREAQLVLENSPAVLFRWKAQSGWPVEMVSGNVLLFGYAPEELLSGEVPFSVLVHPDDLERIAAEVEAYANRGEDRFKQEYRLVTKQGEVRWVDDRTVIERDAKGRVSHYQGVIIDITERKEAEEKRRLSEEHLQSLFRVAPAGLGVVCDRVISEVNHRVYEMTGYTAEELIGKSARMLYPTQEEYDLVGQDKYAQIEAEGIGEVETRWLRKDGNIIDVLLASAPLDPSDLSRGVSFTALDITDRKRTELVMAARMRLLQFAATHTLDELLEETLNEVEELTESVIGFYHYLEEDQETLSLQSWSTRTKTEFCTAQGKGLHYPVSQAGVWVDCIHQRRPVIHDDYAALAHRKGLPPGHAPVVRELVVPVFRGEKIVAILGVGNKPRSYTPQDVETVSLLADLAWSIVESKRAEQALQESERKYRSIVEHAPFGITRSTRDGKLVSVNPALAAILKYDSAEELTEAINRSSIQEVLFPKPSEREPLVETILAGDSWTVFNNRLRCKDGSLVTCRVHSRRIVDENGRAGEFESFQENITDQLAMEQALRENEEMFRVLAETSPVAICLYQGERLVYANPAMERLFGFSSEELCRMKFWDWAHADFKETIRSRGLARLAGEKVPGQYEARYMTKSGEERYVLISAGMMEYQGKATGVASFLDITERKRTEELVRASLEEKEVLLREIHHRVKNNLQVVSSLLFLQSRKFSDPELQACFLESQSRICSMALAHEQLYQSKNLAEVSIRGYVEKLVKQLQESFICPGQEIDCRLAVEDISLDIEKVVPCGLLITELLSNAYKHAFADDRSGLVEISLQGHAGQIELAVSDNGVGFPEDIDFRQAKTLGLQLVTALVNQLNGTLEVERNHGTRFRVLFPG